MNNDEDIRNNVTPNKAYAENIERVGREILCEGKSFENMGFLKILHCLPYREMKIFEQQNF